MRDGLDEARALLPGVRLRNSHQLHDSDRSMVWRVEAQWPDHPATSIIVKRFAGPDEWFARESAALTVCPPDTAIPRLVAQSADPPLIAMTDLGSGPSVADALRGADAAIAADAVRQWALAIGRLHRLTLDRREQFRAELGRHGGEVLLGESRMSLLVDEAAHQLEEHCLHLDVPASAEAWKQFRNLPRRLAPEAAGSLSPSDACPEDNVWLGDRLVLVDFEGAQWRHVAWDLAYLTVPWPTCGCSWRMPGDVASRALESYRQELEAALPYVREPAFRADVDAAALGWSLISTAWYLASALGDGPPAEPADPPRPSRQALILHRLGVARRCADLPAAADLADRLRDRLIERWGDRPLAYAPAFESGD